MAKRLVEERGPEAKLSIFAITQIEIYLSQSTQTEMVNHKCACENYEPAEAK